VKFFIPTGTCNLCSRLISQAINNFPNRFSYQITKARFVKIFVFCFFCSQDKYISKHLKTQNTSINLSNSLVVGIFWQNRCLTFPEVRTNWSRRGVHTATPMVVGAAVRHPNLVRGDHTATPVLVGVATWPPRSSQDWPRSHPMLLEVVRMATRPPQCGSSGSTTTPTFFYF
jgi:hypothetical protein